VTSTAIDRLKREESQSATLALSVTIKINTVNGDVTLTMFNIVPIYLSLRIRVLPRASKGVFGRRDSRFNRVGPTRVCSVPSHAPTSPRQTCTSVPLVLSRSD
jgi:hypothetical protein